MAAERTIESRWRRVSRRRPHAAPEGAAEEQYRLLFENATHGIYRTAPDGRILLANPALLAMLGYDSFEALAQRNLETGGTEADYARGEFKARLEADGEVRGLEAAWRRRDGSTIFVRENARVVWNADRTEFFYAGSVEDITAYKQAEEALRRSEARFQRNIANTPGMVYQFVLRPDGSCGFPFVSDGCRDIYGLEPAAVMADPMVVIAAIHPDDIPDFQESVAQSARTLQPWNWEGRSFHKDGGTRWVQGASRPEAQPNGDILWDGLLVDVTERHAVQEALLRSHAELEARVRERTAALAGANAALQRENEERRRAEETARASGEMLRHVVDNIPQLIFWKDARSVYAGCNQNFARAVGAACPEEIVGRTDFDLPRRFREAEAARAADRRIVQNDAAELRVIETRLRPDGGRAWAETNTVPLHDAGGRVVGVLGTYEDITERTLSEQRIIALNAELTRAYDATIEGWSRALDMRDRETEGHCRRVTDMTLRLAEVLDLPPGERVHIRRGALLHDIGKMGIPDGILLKPGPLTDDEWAIMRRHPALAHEMLSPIDFLGPALDIPRFHHEKWDGTGYPHGLAGEQIPLSARIFSIVDVWDALRSDRPYRAGWAPERISAHIRALSGTHFDPQVVAAFLSLLAADAVPRFRLAA